MGKKIIKKTRSPDPNQTAFAVVQAITGESLAGELPTAQTSPTNLIDGKNPAAVALGRLGGKKGGIARAAKLSAHTRKKIAMKAAKARWSKTPRPK